MDDDPSSKVAWTRSPKPPAIEIVDATQVSNRQEVRFIVSAKTDFETIVVQ